MHTGTFGERLKEARVDSSLTQKELARQVGRSHTWVGYMEIDRYGPDGPAVAMVFALADALGVTVEWLWRGTVA